MKSNSTDKYMVFSLGGEHYAVPLLSVKEVIAVPEVTPIPYTPSYFLGIMNLRGQIISVMDLRAKFGIKPAEKSETAVVICDLGSGLLGIVVDAIESVISPSEKDIHDKPDIHSNKSTEFITGIYKKDRSLVLLLDIDKALSMDDRSAMNKGSQIKKTA